MLPARYDDDDDNILTACMKVSNSFFLIFGKQFVIHVHRWFIFSGNFLKFLSASVFPKYAIEQYHRYYK